MVKGGWCNSKSKKIQVYTFIVALGKMFKGGGTIRNPKYNLGIDFYSGFRKKRGVKYEILKKCAPPPPLPQNLDPPLYLIMYPGKDGSSERTPSTQGYWS